MRLIDAANTACYPVFPSPVWGWRYWRALPNGQLQSPIQGDVLPPDGMLFAKCPVDDSHVDPPVPECECGVAFWSSRERMQVAVDTLKLMNEPRCVITIGVAVGRVLFDDCPAKWDLSSVRGMRGTAVTLSKALRCSAYQVRAILTTNGWRNFPYDVPVFRGTGLTLLESVQ